MNNKMTALVAVLAVSVLALAGVGYAYTAVFQSQTTEVNSDAIVIDGGTSVVTMKTTLDLDTMYDATNKVMFKPTSLEAVAVSTDELGGFEITNTSLALVAKTTEKNKTSTLTINMTGAPTGAKFYVGATAAAAVEAGDVQILAYAEGVLVEANENKLAWDESGNLKMIKKDGSAYKYEAVDLHVYGAYTATAIQPVGDTPVNWIKGTTAIEYEDYEEAAYCFADTITISLTITTTA